MNIPLSSHKLLITLLSVGLPTMANADLIHPSLIVSGALDVDVANSFVGPGASAPGVIFVRQGGLDTDTFFEITGFGTANITGTNPLVGTLTQDGGGIAGAGDGFGGASGAGFEGGAPTGFRSDIDPFLPLSFLNTSATDSFLIDVSLSYQHEVDAGMNATSPDTGIRSDIDLQFNGSEIFNSTIISDTLLGNEVDGAPVGGFGGTVQRDGVFQHQFLVGPSGAASFELDYTLEGVADDFTGIASGNSSYFLSVDSVTAVPEPSSFLLFGGICLFGILPRRRPVA